MLEGLPDSKSQPGKTIAATLLRQIIKQDVEKALWKAHVLRVGAIDVRECHVKNWTVYVWPDTEGVKDYIFISQEYVGDSHPNHEIVRYKDDQQVAKTMMKVPDKVTFIEGCVTKKVTPQSLKK